MRSKKKNVNVKCGFSYDGKDKVAVVVGWMNFLSIFILDSLC